VVRLREAEILVLTISPAVAAEQSNKGTAEMIAVGTLIIVSIYVVNFYCIM
jgi:hypothetical protein